MDFDSLMQNVTFRWMVVIFVLLVTAVLARVVDRRVSDLVVRRASMRTHTAEGKLVRAKRMRTAATMVASLSRYVVVAAGVLVALTIVAHSAFDSVLTGTVIVIMVAFVMQRVLVDMIAGALLLFEGQLAVGDYVKTTQLDGINGIVERIGLRSTTLRSFNGDQHVVLNGSLSGFTRVHRGLCDFEIELFTVDDPDAVEAVEHVCERLRRFEQNFFLRGPQLVSARSLQPRDISHVRIRAIVPPTLEWLCERTLPEQLQAELGDLLLGDPQVFNMDERSFAQYRAAVVLPEHLAQRPPRATRRVEAALERADEAAVQPLRGALLGLRRK